MEPKIALQFSGGKDSLACLHIYRERWDEIVVVWLNTGASYPDVIASMEQWEKRLPHFKMITTNQPAYIKEYGFPCDVLPIQFLKKDVKQLLQSSMACCTHNIWLPLHQAMIEMGIKEIIRGTRLSEKRFSYIRDGYVDAYGIKYTLPLQNWEEEQVWNYLRAMEVEIPAYYANEVTSRDCWDCTAYLDETGNAIRNLPPEKREVVYSRLRLINEAIEESNLIPQILGEQNGRLSEHV